MYHKKLANFENISEIEERRRDLHTAVTCGSVDRELLKITPIFLAVVEQSTVSEAVTRLFKVGRGQ